jgi:hypothetical protein
MASRFCMPITTARPNIKAHRFDVFGPKIGRSLTLFKRNTVEAWIRLEADPAVTWYCERPIVIQDSSPKRIPDFYVVRNGVEEICFLYTQAEANEAFNPAECWPGFAAWCRQNEIRITTLDPTAEGEDDVLLSNWGHVLRELAAFDRYVPGELRSAILGELRKPTTLLELEKRFNHVDPRLVQVACWSLIHSGKATCPCLVRRMLCADIQLQAR